MKSDIYTKTIDYNIKHMVTQLMEAKAVYENLLNKRDEIKRKIEGLTFESGSIQDIVGKVEYIKLNLYEIENIEVKLQQLLKEIEDLKENIKLMDAKKKAIKKYLEKEAKIKERKLQIKESNVAEEVYRSKLINDS